MYKKYKGILQAMTPVYTLKSYLDPILKPQKKEEFVRAILLKELHAHKNRRLGFFVGLKNFTTISVKVSAYDNNTLEVRCFFEAFFYKLNQNEILLAKVVSINAYSVELQLHNKNLKIDVPLSHLSAESVTYVDAGTNKFLGLKNNQKIKENDLMKVKIMNLITVIPTEIDGLRFKIRGSCTGRGLGKI